MLVLGFDSLRGQRYALRVGHASGRCRADARHLGTIHSIIQFVHFAPVQGDSLAPSFSVAERNATGIALITRIGHHNVARGRRNVIQCGVDRHHKLVRRHRRAFASGPIQHHRGLAS